MKNVYPATTCPIFTAEFHLLLKTAAIFHPNAHSSDCAGVRYIHDSLSRGYCPVSPMNQEQIKFTNVCWLACFLPEQAIGTYQNNMFTFTNTSFIFSKFFAHQNWVLS